jgi:uncharacterized membrane protein YhaH (DUF805 family)
MASKVKHTGNWNWNCTSLLSNADLAVRKRLDYYLFIFLVFLCLVILMYMRLIYNIHTTDSKTTIYIRHDLIFFRPYRIFHFLCLVKRLYTLLLVLRNISQFHRRRQTSICISVGSSRPHALLYRFDFIHKLSKKTLVLGFRLHYVCLEGSDPEVIASVK